MEGKGPSLHCHQQSSKRLSHYSKWLVIIVSYRDALGILVGRFTDLILADQDCFQERARWEELLKLIPDKSIVRSLQDKWDDDEDRTSEEKWDNLKREIQKYKKSERVGRLSFIIIQHWLIGNNFP